MINVESSILIGSKGWSKEKGRDLTQFYDKAQQKIHNTQSDSKK